MSGSPNDTYEHHKEYFLPGGDLYIVAGNVLFRVHSFFFDRDSQWFRNRLNVAVAPNQPRPGSTDSSPITIKNSSARDFAKFLWVFYNSTYSIYEASPTEWVAILKIACEYDFIQAKHLAVRGLEQGTLSVVQRLTLYQLYKVDPIHIVPLIAALCARDEGPTNDETEEMGMETSLLIFRARERIRSATPNDGKSPLPTGVDDDDVLQTICSFLGVDNSRFNNAGQSLRPRAPKTRRASSTRRVAKTEPAIRQTGEGTSRHAHVFGDYICPGFEGCRFVAAAPDSKIVAVKKVPGEFEDWEEDLKQSETASQPSMHSFVARSDGSSVGFLAVLPMRTFLFFVGLCWTFIFLFFLKVIPPFHIV